MRDDQIEDQIKGVTKLINEVYTPVSYTHLDVYKRQIQSDAQ